jgi:hypothetical protein
MLCCASNMHHLCVCVCVHWVLHKISVTHLCTQSCTIRRTLTELPDSISDLPALTALSMSRCGSITTLPESFGNLTALTVLDMAGCESVTALPESFGMLVALESLDLQWCTSLEGLPESFGDLTALTDLNIRRCSSITALPESLGNLTALTNLDMSHCYGITTLPKSFGNLTALIQLELSWCTALQHIPSLEGLSALVSLDMSGCALLRQMPDLHDGLVPADGETYDWSARCDACRVSCASHDYSQCTFALLVTERFRHCALWHLTSAFPFSRCVWLICALQQLISCFLTPLSPTPYADNLGESTWRTVLHLPGLPTC